jgi:hypothetical protein
MSIDALIGTDRKQWQQAVLAEAARDRLTAQLPRSTWPKSAIAARLIAFLLRP